MSNRMPGVRVTLTAALAIAAWIYAPVIVFADCPPKSASLAEAQTQVAGVPIDQQHAPAQMQVAGTPIDRQRPEASMQVAGAPIDRQHAEAQMQVAGSEDCK